MNLDVDLAKEAMKRLAAPLGYGGEQGMFQLAAGILSIASVKMSEAIKRITVQRGRDPQDFTLFAYGGGGPLHSVSLARELAIPRVIIPPEAGNFSAVGMLLADIRRDETRTFRRPLNDAAMPDINEEFARIETGLAEEVRADFGQVAIAFIRQAEIRFVGQFHTVRVDVAESDAMGVKTVFLNAYRARYGHALNDAAVEVIALHCSASADTPKPKISQLARAPTGEPTMRRRPVYFAEIGHALEASVFARDQLPSGFGARGPAVIEEYGSTTILGPLDDFTVGEMGEIRINIGVSEETKR
jgi:N-methylhydantoinase A